MNTLIVYATKHGCAETCAQMLREKLTGNVELCNLKDDQTPVLSDYDRIIIGGSIHFGKVQKELYQYCDRNKDTLMRQDKKIGLYICGMMFDKAREELSNSFPNQLLARAVAKEFFGGEYMFEKMNPMERLIVKKVAKVNNDVSTIRAENIDRFAKLMDSSR